VAWAVVPLLSTREHRRAKNADETPRGAALDDRKHFVPIDEEAGPFTCGKMRGLKSAWASLDRPALREPCSQTAIQNGNVVVTEGLEQPPESRGPYSRAVVVNDDLLGICEPDRASGRSKARSCLPGEREPFLRIGEVGNEIGEAGARDVPCFKGRAVAEPYVVVLEPLTYARVDNSNVRTLKALQEPLGRNEVLALMGHRKEALPGWAGAARRN
jgi:hypothetical protein